VGTDRRRFDQLYTELSVALGRLAPRYPLWLRMGERGLDPDRLSQSDALAFCREGLTAFLHDHGLELSQRRQLRLERAVRRFDPSHPTPDEHMARFGESARPRP
jgi:hypothetical protein